MSHYAGQGLEREPFSSSPDPSFLLGTRQHATCLQELEIALRLRRGLNVVTGDIGTGKTTLCRSLLRVFAADAATDVHLLLDPRFDTSEEFLRVILTSVSGMAPGPELGLWDLKEALKQQLFRLGMVEKRLVILVIDEGQKISPENLEILREMLNYETNTAKLLQIVIFGQRELEPTLAAMPNLADRINVRRRLRPLSLAETRAMIRYRLAVASGGAAPRVRFTWPAVALIHLAGGGSPRKTVRLCHMNKHLLVTISDDRSALRGLRFVCSFFEHKQDVRLTLFNTAPQPPAVWGEEKNYESLRQSEATAETIIANGKKAMELDLTPKAAGDSTDSANANAKTGADAEAGDSATDSANPPGQPRP